MFPWFDLILFGLFILAGVIILSVVGTILHYIVPIIAAIIVLLITGSWLYAGIAFVAVAILQLIFWRK